MRLYLERTFDLEVRLWSRLTDDRKQPRIPTWVAAKAVWLAMIARMGSLNALEETSGPHWRKWLAGQELCSADTVSLIYSRQDNQPLRDAIHDVYVTLKRNKALPLNHGQAVAIVDGHESHASFDYHCEDCLTRVIHTEKGDRIQYYHRHVALMLAPGPSNAQDESMRLLLDLEPVQAGEDEVAAARRLIRRVVEAYPRAFDLVLADSLYANTPFLDFLLSLGKHGLIVFKQEQRELYQQALAAMADQKPVRSEFRGRDCRWWDVGNLALPLQHDVPVRVIRSEEHWTTQPRNSDLPKPHDATWMWLTTMDRHQLPLCHAVHIAHQRWDIENYGFNETVTGWHADHVYRHNTNALVGFLLTLFLAYNLFFAFVLRNLKPELRRLYTHRYWARLVEAALVGPSDPLFAPNDA
jgi:hypothetical protein